MMKNDKYKIIELFFYVLIVIVGLVLLIMEKAKGPELPSAAKYYITCTFTSQMLKIQVKWLHFAIFANVLILSLYTEKLRLCRLHCILTEKRGFSENGHSR